MYNWSISFTFGWDVYYISYFLHFQLEAIHYDVVNDFIANLSSVSLCRGLGLEYGRESSAFNYKNCSFRLKCENS